jgi:hypothetical protein
VRKIMLKQHFMSPSAFRSASRIAGLTFLKLSFLGDTLNRWHNLINPV